ncbi:MAG TPA: WecB/TagA/CpsF family glycosyltransferase [Verrucomicrobiae bacterium]|jgi:N-acetylglucosaminyldiphosphoundecaprenol N-acetyl-beta-D-mannosaminyltransferase|nr:WecB/TagA/CpsF family glycosyltransferase [Verrucomicrobiae bacterium]
MENLKIAAKEPEDLRLFDVPLHRVGVGRLHAFIEKTALEGTKALILNVNIHCMVLSFKNAWMREILNQAQMIYCDGDGVKAGLRILGMDTPPKVAFTRWIWDLAAFAERKQLRLFLLGAKPGIAEKAGACLKARFPKLEIAGVHDGYFKKEGPETEDVIRQINASDANILIVGFGMPIQERWLYDNWHKIDVNIFLPGGAVLDYASGMLGQAPRWMIQWHLEWLFRIYEDPKRLFWRYAYDIPVFFSKILLTKAVRVLGREK